MKSKLKVIGFVITLAFFTFFSLTLLPKLQYLIIYSGSMEPTIPKGSLVIAKDPQEADISKLQVGDIITFNPNKSDLNTLVTHRVSKISTAIFTKGDNNPQSDLWALQRSQIRGLYTLNIPYLGYFLHFLKTYPWYLAVIFGLIITFPLDKNFFMQLSLNKRQLGKALAFLLPFLIIFWAKPALAQWNNTLFQSNYFATDSINKYLSITPGTSQTNTGVPVASGDDNNNNNIALDFGTLNKPTTFSEVLNIKNLTASQITIHGTSNLSLFTLGFGIDMLDTITLKSQETTTLLVTISPLRNRNKQLYLGEIYLTLNNSNFYMAKIPTKFYDK